MNRRTGTRGGYRLGCRRFLLYQPAMVADSRCHRVDSPPHRIDSWGHPVDSASSGVFTLVPKLRLGTHGAKLRFAASSNRTRRLGARRGGQNGVSKSVRSQTEFGNEATEVWRLPYGNLSRSARTIRAEFGQKVRGGGVKKVGVLGTLGVLRVGGIATQRTRDAAICSTWQLAWQEQAV